MNYRHDFHAGNFADVTKHILLTRIIAYLQRKEAGFLFVDTHAGTGRYDLTADKATRTGEWQSGIGKFMAAAPHAPAPVRELITPYLDIIGKFNPDGGLANYPGSPRVAHAMRRPQDRLSLMEMHPEDAETLAAEFAGASAVKVHALDGWIALKSQLPPREKRGLVLIDPPFEDRNEFQAIVDGVYQAHKRFATGTYCLWYPIKNRAILPSFYRSLKSIGFKSSLVCELQIRPGSRSGAETFDGTGMIILNAPYSLEAELKILMPWLVKVLEEASGSGSFKIATLD